MAEKEGKEGYIFTLQRPSINPFLQYSPNREGRKALFDGYAARGNRDNNKDNKEIIAEMVNLRAERAKLMGYKSHAHFILEENMSETPENVYDFLDKIWAPALKKGKEEREKMNRNQEECLVEEATFMYYTVQNEP